MLFRTLVIMMVVFGGALGWIGPVAAFNMLGGLKDHFVAALDEAGVDTKDCKARSVHPLDPSGGVSDCVQDVYRQVQTRLEAEAEIGLRKSNPNEAPELD
jgi:hypothetical protein